MAQVSLQINGYGYILGCADGEEEHLRALAADLDRRIEEIKATTGPAGEARMLVMAALVLSDELHDLRGDAAGAPARPAPKIGRRLRGIVKKAETIAEQTEAPLSVHAESAEAGTDSVAATPDHP